MNDDKKIRVSKLSAARRQLGCAIELWFAGKEEVSIHTLAAAAHQIIYDINKQKGAGEMLFDSIVLKDEYRSEFVTLLKRDMNFFKHADKDPEGLTEFAPITTIMFILFSIVGLQNIGEGQNDVEKVFGLWLAIHHPNWIRRGLIDKLGETVPPSVLSEMRQVKKQEFFELGLQSLAVMRARGIQ